MTFLVVTAALHFKSTPYSYNQFTGDFSFVFLFETWVIG